MEDSQQASPPALPPRNKQAGLTESRLLQFECVAHTPSALLACIASPGQHDGLSHNHVFYTCPGDVPAVPHQGNDLDDQDQVVDKENRPPPRFTPVLSRFHCMHCHAVLCLSTESPSLCTAADFPTHHYHRIGSGLFQCCGCQYAVEAALEKPVLPMSVFQALAASRVGLAVAHHDRPSQESTLQAVLGYLEAIVRGERPSIHINSPDFLTRIGDDEASHQLLSAVGLVLQEGCFYAPDQIDADRLNRIRKEIELALYELADPACKPTGFNLGETSIEGILGSSKEERGKNLGDETINRAYSTLGLARGATDTLVSWTYRRLVEEDPKGQPKYCQALSGIAESSQSEALLIEAAAEQSQISTGANVAEAYQHFGIVHKDDIDDSFVIDCYNLKSSEEPLAMKQHREKLCQIAEARHSKILFEFLHTQDTFPSRRRSDPALEESSEQTEELPPDMPVGLENIGNTCYLNSLLQYYFTLTPFRDTIIHMEDYVEDEEQPDWVPKKIGGIQVDQAEVRRAKQFVSLLRELFVSLQQATRKSIAPENELAYMALLNEKDELPAAEAHVTEKKEEFPASQVTYEPPSLSPTPASNTNDTKTDSTSDARVGDDSPKETSPDSINDTEGVSKVDDSELPPPYEEIVGNTAQNEGEKPIPSSSMSATVPTIAKKPAVDMMMLGKQQDVTECMGNMMYLVEAALRPLETCRGEQVRDMIRDLFYGKARQILSYKDTRTNQNVTKKTDEEFSHVIVSAAEGKDLYDGLDEYFFADQVENFSGGRETTREVSVVNFPPILQVQVQRVQYSLERRSAYKSNAFIQFDETIYLDRYSDSHFETLAESRAQVATWRKELEACASALKQLTENPTYPMPVPDMLEATAHILREYREDEKILKDHGHEYEQALAFLQQEAASVRSTIEEHTQRMAELRSQIKSQYAHLKEEAYRLHAVFVHQGQASYGHYWIYICDHSKKQWWKYNDSIITRVDECEIYRDTTGSTANPYFLVYVKQDQLETLVQTTARDTAER